MWPWSIIELKQLKQEDECVVITIKILEGNWFDVGTKSKLKVRPNKKSQRGQCQPQKWKWCTQNQEMKPGSGWTPEMHEGSPGTSHGLKQGQRALLATPKDVRGREKTLIIWSVEDDSVLVNTHQRGDDPKAGVRLPTLASIQFQMLVLAWRIGGICCPFWSGRHPTVHPHQSLMFCHRPLWPSFMGLVGPSPGIG